MAYPSLVLPAPHDPSIPVACARNNDALLRWSTNRGPLVFGIGNPIWTLNGSGVSDPVPNDDYVDQSGLIAVTFASGTGTLTLPAPFPNGWLSLQMNGTHTYTYDPSSVSYTVGPPSTLTITVTASGSPTGSLNVDILARGW
jgi:hypothetical protein